ncbi:MAG: hypothetical protein HYW78_04630 [Parcubacteria group bacterium]|nr:hypothetical protein [Parcubacteria group bacterium]
MEEETARNVIITFIIIIAVSLIGAAIFSHNKVEVEQYRFETENIIVLDKVDNLKYYSYSTKSIEDFIKRSYTVIIAGARESAGAASNNRVLVLIGIDREGNVYRLENEYGDSFLQKIDVSKPTKNNIEVKVVKDTGMIGVIILATIFAVVILILIVLFIFG